MRASKFLCCAFANIYILPSSICRVRIGRQVAHLGIWQIIYYNYKEANLSVSGCGDAGMRGCGDAGMRGCGDAGMRGCGDAGMRGCGDAGMRRRPSFYTQMSAHTLPPITPSTGTCTSTKMILVF